jgi:hypothetical protein
LKRLIDGVADADSSVPYTDTRGPAFDLPIPVTDIVSVSGTVTAGGFCFLLSIRQG